MKRAAFALAAFALPFAALAAFDASAYAHKATLTFSGYSGAEPLANFPALVKVAAGTGDFFYSDCALSDGKDVRFCTAAGEELASSVVTWDEDGTSEFYVRVPELTASTTIYMVWGNADADARDPMATPFARDEYMLSWGFDEDGEIALDGTRGSAHGIGVNAPASTTDAVVGKARSFDSASSQYFRLVAPSWNPLRVATNYTYECWAKWDAAPSANCGIFGLSRNNWNVESGVNLKTSGMVEMRDGNGSTFGSKESASVPATGEWHYLVLTRDNGAKTSTLYVDGVAASTTVNPNTKTETDWSFDVGTVRTTGYVNNYFTGLVDEVRMSPVCRSADYVTAVYSNITDFAGFCLVANADGTSLPAFMPTARQYAITVSAGAGGSVSPALSGALYDEGDVVEVTATPSSDDSAFYAWEGNCPTLQVFTASLKLPVDQARSVTATFGKAYYVSAADGDDETGDGTSAKPYASIEAGFAAVTNNAVYPAVLLVGDGDYELSYASVTGDISGDDGGCSYAMYVTNSIAIRSVNGPGATFVNCRKQGGKGAFELDCAGAVLDGFTVTNAANSSWNQRGCLAQIWRGGCIQNCVFADSTMSAQSNAGVAALGGYIRNCVFRNFKPGSGSSYAGPLFARDAVIDSCVFSNNTHYSGIRVNRSLLRNCLFADNKDTFNNSTYGNGGALYDTGDNSGRSLAENCTFVNNYAKFYGGAVYGAMALVNCAFAGNATEQAANGPDFYNSLLACCVAPTASAAGGNIVATAGMTDAAAGDYSPTSVSPTRDAGLPTAWLYEPGRTDIAGSDRVIATPDIGAFEYLPTGDEFAVSVSANVYTGTDTLAVTFAATIEGADDVTYAWDFGDGTTSTEASPAHIYSAPGYYAVTLTITDASDATRTTTFDGGAAFIKVMPSTCYVRAAGESTPVEPYATPETAANDVYTAFLMSPAKIDVGEGDIPIGDIIEFYIDSAIEMRGKGPEVSRINLGGGNKRFFLRNAGAVMADLTVRNGHSNGTWNEGLVNISGGATVTNCVIRDGTRANSGVVRFDGTGGRLVDCVISGGYSSQGCGGGLSIYTESSDAALALVENCVITNNSVQAAQNIFDGLSYGAGAGIHIYCGKAKIRNSLVARNRLKAYSSSRTDNSGAGIYVGAPNGANNVAVVVENCTVVSNSVDYGYAAGIYMARTGSASILAATNTVAWGNFAGGTTGELAEDDIGANNGANVVFSHSLAPEFADAEATAGWTVDACKSGDPLFRDFDGGDFTFGGRSPLANAGERAEWMTGASDLAGNPRLSGRPDIGCFECSAGAGMMVIVR
ncbi:MAG: DUF2341 domain-containing protein [Kiritimatiellae bacterium]|nr:DUF2341 domain-containing protein [Kiritimatiellia bacterium]